MSSRRQLDLERQARAFAGQLSEALNGTVTDGLRLTVFMNPSRRAVIGNRVSKLDLIGAPIALTVTRAPAQLELHLLHTLDLDDSRQFLTTNKSTYTLRAAGSGTPIVTYDYARGSPNEFPAAHMHLHGRSDALQSMLERCRRVRDKQDDLHFPVGGPRFRPCLEDLIEFCILERLVTPRDGWQAALNRSRDRYRERQLKAATREFPELAASVLKSEGWTVTAPDE